MDRGYCDFLYDYASDYAVYSEIRISSYAVCDSYVCVYVIFCRRFCEEEVHPMIRKICLVLATLYLLLVMGGLLLNRDKEELRWRQNGSIEQNHDVYTNINEWAAFNIVKDEEWKSTSNDPTLLSPLFTVADAAQTYLHIEMVTRSNQVQVFWRGQNEDFAEERSKVFDSRSAIEMIIDGDVEQIRIDPAEQPGVTFAVHQVDVKKYK
ncbi:hypothetical protein D3C78_1202040 [compost metagenome]